MALTDFFRINLPYGIKRNSKGEWFAFNREYMPLGFNDYSQQESIFKHDAYASLPIYTKYKGLTEKKLLKIAYEGTAVERDEDGKINTVFLYKDGSNPQSNPKAWDEYFDKIKELSKLSIN